MSLRYQLHVPDQPYAVTQARRVRLKDDPWHLEKMAFNTLGFVSAWMLPTNTVRSRRSLSWAGDSFSCSKRASCWNCKHFSAAQAWTEGGCLRRSSLVDEK